MAIIGVANLAVKVSDLDAAISYYRRAGGQVSGPEPWRDGRRADVELGPLRITLFTAALYEAQADLGDDAFLHVALFTDNLDHELEGHEPIWGPEVISGPSFGTRRVAFVTAPGAMRLELMEQIE